MTAVEWYFDKIKSHFEHDGDLFETAMFTYSIAKLKEKEQLEKAYRNGYTQCQEDMYEFGKLVLDTFHSEGKTHSGKDRLARVKFDEWFKQLNKQD